MKVSKLPVRIIVGAALAVALVVLAIGILIPVSMSDGTEKFQGEEKKIAQYAKEEIQDFYGSGNNLISAAGTYNYRVETINEIEIPQIRRFSTCDKLYEVTFGKIGLFGNVGATEGPMTVCLRGEQMFLP